MSSSRHRRTVPPRLGRCWKAIPVLPGDWQDIVPLVAQVGLWQDILIVRPRWYGRDNLGEVYQHVVREKSVPTPVQFGFTRQRR